VGRLRAPGQQAQRAPRADEQGLWQRHQHQAAIVEPAAYEVGSLRQQLPVNSCGSHGLARRELGRYSRNGAVRLESRRCRLTAGLLEGNCSRYAYVCAMLCMGGALGARFGGLAREVELAGRRRGNTTPSLTSLEACAGASMALSSLGFYYCYYYSHSTASPENYYYSNTTTYTSLMEALRVRHDGSRVRSLPNFRWPKTLGSPPVGVLSN
jgi:hypothetical protein